MYDMEHEEYLDKFLQLYLTDKSYYKKNKVMFLKSIPDFLRTYTKLDTDIDLTIDASKEDKKKLAEKKQKQKVYQKKYRARKKMEKEIKKYIDDLMIEVHEEANKFTRFDIMEIKEDG